jgi:hypothetical protein
MENNQHVAARKLMEEIIDSFSYRYYDKKLQRNISLPANYYEVENAGKLLLQLEGMNIDNPQLSDNIASLKEIVENSKKKKFTFTFKMILVLTVWLFFTGFGLYNGFSNITGKYQYEEADELYQERLDYLMGRLEHYKTNPLISNRDENISRFENEIKQHKEVSAELYLESQNKYFRDRKIRDIMVFVYSIVIVVLYLLSTRAPVFVINKKKKKLIGKKKSSFLGALILAVWNMEDDEVSTTNSSIFNNSIGKPIYSESAIDGTITVVGHTGSGDSGGGGLFLLVKYSLLAFILILAFYTMVILMPLFILYNFVTNNLYKFLDRFDKNATLRVNNTTEAPAITPIKINIPTAKNIHQGGFYYAKYSADGFFYYAKVDSITDQSYRVTYYDDFQQEVAFNEICDIDFAVQNLRAFANWENKGLFYPCSVEKIKNKITVKYEDGVTENVREEQLRFI